MWDKFLQAFVMTTVDGSPQDAAIVCQRLYAERLARALRSNEYELYNDQNDVAVAPQDAEDGIVPDLYRQLPEIAHCIPIVPDQAVGDLRGAKKRAAKTGARRRKQGHPRARAPHAKLTVKAHKDPVAFSVVISTSSSAIHAISSTLSTLLNVRFSNMYTHIPHDDGEQGLLQRLDPLLGKVFRAHMPGQAGRQRPGRTKVPTIEITRDQENYNKPIGR